MWLRTSHARSVPGRVSGVSRRGGQACPTIAAVEATAARSSSLGPVGTSTRWAAAFHQCVSPPCGSQVDHAGPGVGPVDGGGDGQRGGQSGLADPALGRGERDDLHGLPPERIEFGPRGRAFARDYRTRHVAADFIRCPPVWNGNLLVDALRVVDDDPTPVPSVRDRFGRWVRAAGAGPGLATVRLPGRGGSYVLFCLCRVRLSAGRGTGRLPAGGGASAERPAPPPLSLFGPGRRRPPAAGHPVPPGGRGCPGAISGEERGTGRGAPRGKGRNALKSLVSPVGLEPTAPRLKVQRAASFRIGHWPIPNPFQAHWHQGVPRSIPLFAHVRPLSPSIRPGEERGKNGGRRGDAHSAREPPRLRSRRPGRGRGTMRAGGPPGVRILSILTRIRSDRARGARG